MYPHLELNMTTRNSCSVILNHIKPYSRVLEIGCGWGKMTKYLKENLNCQICIIEVDEEIVEKALPYCNKSYIGKIEGDVEKNIWFDKINKKFDYIILADVLEHLINPEEVLNKCSKLLDKNGKIWISIPNIGHNSVLIDLLQDKFIYRDLGLLDKTHLRFFTESSLEDMINRCGLKIFKKDNLENAVSCTEFNNNYSQLPKEISNFLITRKNGEVYQFVWGLQIK